MLTTIKYSLYNLGNLLPIGYHNNADMIYISKLQQILRHKVLDYPTEQQCSRNSLI